MNSQLMLLEKILDSVNYGILMVTRTKEIIYSNTAFQKIVNLNRYELENRTLTSLLIEDVIFLEKEEWTGTVFLKKCGKVTPTNIRVSGISDTDYYLIHFENTYDYIRINEKIFNSMSEGVVITDRKNMIVSVNTAFSRATGFSEEDLLGKNPNILSSGYHDKLFYINMWEEIHEVGKWSGELWNKKKDGTVFLERLSIYEVKNSEGVVTNYIGILSDVTKQKRDETDLNLYARVFESSGEGIMITNLDSEIVGVNPAFTRITGYSKEQVLGKKPNILHSGYHNQEFYKEMWNSISRNGTWKGEVWNKRKIGQIYPELLSINPVRDESGKITHYVGIFSDISNQKDIEEKLSYLAHYDQLTGLHNRYSFYHQLEKNITNRKTSEMIAILYIDLDRLKIVNDSLGHTIGDKLIKNCAERLGSVIQNKGFIARLGGDEFAVILRDLKDKKEAEILSRKINKELEIPFLIGPHEIVSSCSIGISFYPLDGKDTNEIIKNADIAMYKAKQLRKGTQIFKSYMKEIASNKMEIINQLHRAIERNELTIFYQPQIDIFDETVVGFEALLRWNNKNKGTILPDEFLPLAEETGLIIPIGRWVLNTVSKQIKKWENNGLSDFRVAVNLSASQFVNEALISDLKHILFESMINPKHLELEITESISMYQFEAVNKILKEVSDLGIKIAIDDFGTGHSSLSYLKSYPVETLKIDRSFIRNLSGDTEKASIVKAIINMAKELNLQVVAEGVETIAEIQFLKKLNCKYVQGNYYANPMPIEELEIFINDNGYLII